MKEMKFPELMDKIIEDFLDRKRKERKIGCYYASELPFCMRRNYFVFKKPKKFDLATLKIFESGILFHNWFKNVLFKGYTSDAIKDLEYEGSLEHKDKDFVVRGRYDDVVMLEWEKKPVLIEVKTARSLKFINDVKKHHFIQINFYLSMMNLKKGFVIYLDRTNLQHKIFEVERSDEVFRETIKRARALHKHLIQDKIPLAEAKINPDLRWMCDYCNWRLECMEE